jgi:hypothetical protein
MRFRGWTLSAAPIRAAGVKGAHALIAEAAAPFEAIIARPVTIPGIGQRTAEVIIAETGGDMARFATAARPHPGQPLGGDQPGGARLSRHPVDRFRKAVTRQRSIRPAEDPPRRQDMIQHWSLSGAV